MEQESPDNSPVHLIYIDTEMLSKRIAGRCLIELDSYADSIYPMTEKPMHVLKTFGAKLKEFR